MLVSTDLSGVRAIGGGAGRSSKKRFTSSAAMCWASAALPPLPKSKTFPPPRKAEAKASAARTMRSKWPSKKASLSRALSRKISSARFRNASLHTKNRHYLEKLLLSESSRLTPIRAFRGNIQSRVMLSRKKSERPRERGDGGEQHVPGKGSAEGRARA